MKSRITLLVRPSFNTPNIIDGLFGFGGIAAAVMLLFVMRNVGIKKRPGTDR